MSIFNGIDEILDNWLGLIGHGNKFGDRVPKYKSKTAAITLSEEGSPLNRQVDNDSVSALIADCVTQMETNLDKLGQNIIPPSN